MLAALLERAPEVPGDPGRKLLLDVSFDDALFDDVARFADVTFERASFHGATFRRFANFKGAKFKNVSFFGATFEQGVSFMDEVELLGDVNFNGARFKGGAWFPHATFGDETRFDEALFEGRASFGGASFGWVRFGKATFGDETTFEDATFRANATFEDARFVAEAAFTGAKFGWVSFAGARFETTRDLGPLIASTKLELDRAVFEQPMRIEVATSELSGERAQFRGGVDLFVRYAEISLEDADFGGPSLIATQRVGLSGEGTTEFAGDPLNPRLLSLRRAKVAQLTIAGLDMGPCWLAGAHGLDELRLEDVQFASTPSGWQRTESRPLPVRWTRRQAIAEEHRWRTLRGQSTGWDAHESEPGVEGALTVASPRQIAAMYRALRKGLEDSKDEPDAADFYYGEMEMRRQAPGTPRGQRIILWLYWLVSGYGLRASRALISLAITLVAFAFLFDWWGFRPDRPFGRTLLFGIESSSSLFRVTETKGFALTAAGEVMQVMLRLLGPLFIGLALLSLRGRVKR